MAAPTTSYKSEKLPVIKGNSSGGIATQNDIYIAKFLQNTTPPSGDDWGDGYFNSTDTEAQKLAKIKDIFKIDGLCLVAKGAADGSAAETGFIGYCNSRNSGNGLYHKTERFSGLKVPIGASGGGAASTGELLNDGSLNVMGTITAGAGTYITPDPANNGFALTANYRSSYYNATTAYGIKWRKQGDSTYNTKSLGTIGVKTKVALSAQSIDVDPTDTLYVEAPNIYEIQGFITNEEGTTILQFLNVTMTPITLSLYYGTTRENAYAYGTAVNYYKSKRIDEGATLYDNSTATDPVAAGFYMDKSGTAPYFYYECDSSGVIIGIGEYNPSASRILYEPSGWGTTEANAITDANSTSWIPKYTIYLDNDGKWYANSTGTTLATDGYWLVGDSEFSYESIYLINGIQQF